MLITVVSKAVNELLQEKVNRLAGPAYSRDKNRRPSGLVRWGSKGGSIYLSDQNVKKRVPRVRNKYMNKEKELSAYKNIQILQKLHSLMTYC